VGKPTAWPACWAFRGPYSPGGFISWFFGYILLSASVLYVVGPLIWRAGGLRRRTIPDFFGRHFESRALELVMALGHHLADTGRHHPVFGAEDRACLAGVAGASFGVGDDGWWPSPFYVVIAGLRASAFVAILKDGLMLGPHPGWCHGYRALAGQWALAGIGHRDPAPLRSQVFPSPPCWCRRPVLR
jgi:hypothetical protein